MRGRVYHERKRVSWEEEGTMRGRGYHESKGVPTHLPQLHVHRSCPPCHPRTSGLMDHMEEGGTMRGRGYHVRKGVP